MKLKIGSKFMWEDSVCEVIDIQEREGKFPLLVWKRGHDNQIIRDEYSPHIDQMLEAGGCFIEDN